MIRPVNVHGTAIVIGTTGLIFVGPSGSGKSSIALHCLHRAHMHGLFSALVGDDQVLVHEANGHIVARTPPSIAGLAEIRGAGVYPVNAIPRAVLQRAIMPVVPPFSERIAPENEDFEVLSGFSLPLSRLPVHPGCDPFAALATIAPEIT
ncbi:MAG: HPr kinase/phosphorylase [Shinella sp.]|nr:HPr kinase/phosphorylase [Shinella sp.]